MEEKKNDSVLAERLRLLRQERKLTQEQVAKEVGLSARGYQDYELGRQPNSSALLHIAEFYGVSTDWLLGRTDKREVNR